MKRLVLSLTGAASILSFVACEQHKVADLPPHYLHKGHSDAADAGHQAGDHKAGDEPKAAAPHDPHAKPAEVEKKGE